MTISERLWWQYGTCCCSPGQEKIRVWRGETYMIGSSNWKSQSCCHQFVNDDLRHLQTPILDIQDPPSISWEDLFSCLFVGAQVSHEGFGRVEVCNKISKVEFVYVHVTMKTAVLYHFRGDWDELHLLLHHAFILLRVDYWSLGCFQKPLQY